MLQTLFPCAALWQKNGCILLLTCSLKTYCFNSLWAFTEYKVVQDIPSTIRFICLIFCILKFIKYFHLLLHLILKNKTEPCEISKTGIVFRILQTEIKILRVSVLFKVVEVRVETSVLFAACTTDLTSVTPTFYCGSNCICGWLVHWRSPIKRESQKWCMLTSNYLFQFHKSTFILQSFSCRPMPFCYAWSTD